MKLKPLNTGTLILMKILLNCATAILRLGNSNVNTKYSYIAKLLCHISLVLCIVKLRVLNMIATELNTHHFCLLLCRFVGTGQFGGFSWDLDTHFLWSTILLLLKHCKNDLSQSSGYELVE